MEEIESLFTELRKFSNKIIEFQTPVLEKDILNFENRFNIRVPNEFKYFLLKSNGLDLMGNTIFGLNKNEMTESLESVYYREHFLVSIPQMQHIIPISPDGGGNFYCLDTTSNQIIFWLSNYQYSLADAPEVVYNSFTEFVKEVFIDWTLKEFDGSV
jgi:hypothetical protein